MEFHCFVVRILLHGVPNISIEGGWIAIGSSPLSDSTSPLGLILASPLKKINQYGKEADSLSKTLDKAGCRVTTLHGGKSQEQREINLEGFRTKRFNVLVATEVAGRGIDILDIAHVINHDMPGSIEMYTHRIGRTGRAGKTGVATTFLTFHDTKVFYEVK